MTAAKPAEQTWAQQLREPFPAAFIGKLPKPTKADNPKGKCSECGGWHGLPAVHLDYVGHAAVTDRLLQVDPAWTWKPLAFTPEGLPALDRVGNLWIKLTISGVTRLGVGDGKNAKECIGDAIRNAAMRFGVALDLWAKEDLHAFEQASEDARPQAAPKAKSPTPAAEGKNTASTDDALLALLATTVQLVDERGGNPTVFETAVETARKDESTDFGAWLQFQHDHWLEQPVQSSYAKAATDAQAARRGENATSAEVAA